MYRFSLRQNAGYLGLASLLIFLIYPLQFLMEIFKKMNDNLSAPPPSRYELYNLYGLGHNFTETAAVLFTMVFLLLPFVLALMLNSYMHSRKAADVYHALPVRRETLLGVNAAVAMTIVAAPLVISNVIILIASLVKFGSETPVGFQLLDMCCWLVVAFLIYTVTTFVCTQTGTVFDTFLFSGVLFFLLPAGLMTLILLNESFLYGYEANSQLMRIALRLSPVLFPIERFMFHYNPYRFGVSPEVNDFDRYFPSSNWTLAIYLLLAAALLLLSMRLYTRRHSERAETTTSRGALSTLVQAAGSLLGGIFTGLLFYSIGNNSNTACIIWTIIGTLVIFAVLEIILNRGFKTLLRRAPVGGIVTALSLACVAIVTTGGLGFESRVPSAESLRGVQVDWDGSYSQLGEDIIWNLQKHRDPAPLTNEEALRTVVEFHRAVVEERFDRHTTELLEEGKTEAYGYVKLNYDKSLPMRRSYYAYSSDTLEKLIPLEINPEYQQHNNPFFIIDEKSVAFWTVSDAFGWNEKEVRLSAADNQRLLEAVRADYLERTAEDALHPDSTVVAHLTALVPPPEDGVVRTAARAETRYAYDRTYRYGNVLEAYTPVFGKHTKALLEELGLLPEAPDVSKCVGVRLSIGNNISFDYDWDEAGEFEIKSHTVVNDSLISVSNNVGSDFPNAFEDDRKDHEERLKEDEDYRRYADAGNDLYFLNDREDIAALAKAIAPSWRADEPFVHVNFYSNAGEMNRQVIVPLSKLPVTLQEKLAK